MITFEQDKQRKLKRQLGLRFMNAIGMVAWSPSKYGGATQYLRLLHPLTWVWVVVMFIYGVFVQGIPDTCSDILYCLKHEAVIW